jgi:LPXTG-motif cell wall-anchored protein
LEQQPAAPATSSGSWSWLWLAIPAALAIAGFLAFRRRRREAVVAEDTVGSYAEPEADTAPEPAPRLAETLPPAAKPAARPALKLPPKVRTVPPAPPQPVGPRARLEVEFIPARASATADAAVVEFELVLRNVGDVPAANIRIDSRMFNASATKEMAEFLKGPIHDTSGSPHVQIAPGDELRLASAMAMPKQDVREILMEGQRLFVPAVASIVAWDWGTDGRERIALSWLVGRETENRTAKMGAFRLDLGPRIYRQVGVRPLKLVA